MSPDARPGYCITRIRQYIRKVTQNTQITKANVHWRRRHRLCPRPRHVTSLTGLPSAIGGRGREMQSASGAPHARRGASLYVCAAIVAHRSSGRARACTVPRHTAMVTSPPPAVTPARSTAYAAPGGKCVQQRNMETSMVQPLCRMRPTQPI